MSTIRTLTLLALIVVCSASLAVAGPGGGAGEGKGHPKPGRLGTPSEVTCTLSGDMLTLAWGAVELAQQYRVYLEASDGGELVDTVPAPTTSYTHPLSDLSENPAVVVKGHVRALASKMGKDASRPSKPVTCQ